ncbi:MAG: hypothetical protein ACH36H_02515 [Candidatus Nanopelagicales bacterium]
MTTYVEADGGSRRNPGPAAHGALVLVADEVVHELALRANRDLPAHQVRYPRVPRVPRVPNKRADALINEVLDTGDAGLLIDRAP